MEAAEGKLFRPLAFTKTFALLASILLAITILPPLAEQLFKIKRRGKVVMYFSNACLLVLSFTLFFTQFTFFGLLGSIAGLGGIISVWADGRKLIIVVATAVITGDATSVVAK